MTILVDGRTFIGAVVATGIAASGLVDASKAYFGGVNRIGFAQIAREIGRLTPEEQEIPPNGLPQKYILESLFANWANGTALTKQINIAKSLVLMHLSPANAVKVATNVNVDPAVLSSIATKFAAGTPLSPTESELHTRFDLIVSALLDAVYQKSEQMYGNGTRTAAFIFAVFLALIEGWALHGGMLAGYLMSNDVYMALLVGVFAAPIAPIAKDASKAVGAAIRSRVEKQL